MIKCGDNINSCHDMKDLINEPEHLLTYCTQCKKRFYVRPADRKKYYELHRKDALQPGGNNLYYKYFGKLHTI